MGGVVGLDMPALLEISDALGYDRNVMIVLLPYAEAGLMEALDEQKEVE